MRIINLNGTLNSYNISGYEIRDGDRFGYKVIAVIYSKDNWCAFRGLTDWDDSRVAERGDEIPLEIAQYLFPTVAANIPRYYND